MLVFSNSLNGPLTWERRAHWGGGKLFPERCVTALFVLAMVLEQQTELNRREIMTDTGLYRCGVWPVHVVGLPVQPANREHRRRPLLAHRPLGRPWPFEWCRTPSRQYESDQRALGRSELELELIVLCHWLTALLRLVARPVLKT
jgi:hypothetical protein